MKEKYLLLLIEDNIHDARIFYEILTYSHPNEFEVIHVPNLHEGINKLNQSRFDAIVLDLTLPDSTDLHTFYAIRKVAENTPIIINSGIKDNDLTMEAIRAGAQDYIQKGMYDGEIISRIILFAIERKKFTIELEDTRNLLLAKTEALKEANKKLYDLNMDKDRLYSIVSYDLLDSFNNLLSSSEMLLGYYYEMDEEDKFKHVQLINTQSRDILTLIKNILKWTAFTTGKMVYKPVKFDVNKVIAESSEFYQKAAEEKNLNLTFMDFANLSIEADKFMVETILRILLSFCIKFSSPGGKITIRALLKNFLPIIEIECNNIIISQKDFNDLFIIEEIKPKQGSYVETGSAIGLMICKELVEKNNGSLDTKYFDKIIIFSITFPISSSNN